MSFQYRSQTTSKGGKNKKLAHESLGECVTGVLSDQSKRAQNLACCIIADEQPTSQFGEHKFDPFVSNQWMIVLTAKTILNTVIIVVVKFVNNS